MLRREVAVAIQLSSPYERKGARRADKGCWKNRLEMCGVEFRFYDVRLRRRVVIGNGELDLEMLSTDDADLDRSDTDLGR